jgi:two-component system, NtrC family, sensor histidine kinase GlrK
MRLSLFSRLALGYLAIFLMVTAVSAYAVLQLHRFDELTDSVLKVDNRILDYEKILADLLLSQSRYEQKFAISRDEALYSEFLSLRHDFNLQLATAIAVGDSAAGALLSKVQQDYRNYEELVIKEAGFLRVKKAYPQTQFKQEKDAIVDRILLSLEKLRAEQQDAMYSKVRDLAEAAEHAREVSIIITVACLISIVVMSLIVTRSITRPIAILKTKTREIAQGHFEGGLAIKSPPEIGELAAAFNLMCERLKELERMKADFFSSMSHELRTPLTSIKEGTGLLLDGVGGETTVKQRKLLAILAEESNRLIGVVNSLLDLSKMEAGMMTYEFDLVNIDPLIRRAIAEITPLVEAKQINLESRVDASLPPLRLDPERILQVLRNLLGNAVKFTPNGGRVSIVAKSVNGKLQVCVADSGPGVPAESLTTIFEKFSQGSHRGAHTRNGTGLGLAIAKNIIKSHGGEIWAESQSGQGSSFVFVLHY